MRVKLDGVAVRFGKRHVLTDVSLVVDHGESVAIVGPSGSGKSTLLAAIGGIQPIDAGEVTLGNGNENSRVAWILQTVNVLPSRTVIDNAMIGGYGLGFNAQECRHRASQILKDVGLDHVAGSWARSISGGERQRLVVARSLVGEPELVLADEPTAQLDRFNAERVTEALLDNRAPGTTVIMATHDDQVAARCARTVTLKDGRLDESR